MNKFEVGSHVKCVSVDRYGFNGRDFHPFYGKDEGFDGIVVSVSREEEAFGEEPIAPENDIFCYRVCRASDGKVLDLMSHEVADFRS